MFYLAMNQLDFMQNIFLKITIYVTEIVGCYLFGNDAKYIPDE